MHNRNDQIIKKILQEINIIDDHEASLHQQMDENGKDLFSG